MVSSLNKQKQNYKDTEKLFGPAQPPPPPVWLHLARLRSGAGAHPGEPGVEEGWKVAELMLKCWVMSHTEEHREQ